LLLAAAFLFGNGCSKQGLHPDIILKSVKLKGNLLHLNNAALKDIWPALRVDGQFPIKLLVTELAKPSFSTAQLRTSALCHYRTVLLRQAALCQKQAALSWLPDTMHAIP
jgi:hypothetical protein